ncbi:MAG: RnfABCDGE type electron transport complex subunit G [Deltaproteobacteria bacterium]|nr:RnfABCDGE type electron transport complex subunit G [Deltaproteobacteria bacterium]
MGDTLKLGFVLTIICVIAAGSLAKVYDVTSVIIKKNEKELDEKKRKEIIPQAVAFEEKKVDGKTIFIGKDAQGKAIGSIFKIAPRGYAGPINAMIGIDEGGKVMAVSITKLDQAETPGLGTKVTGPKFRDQFKGKDGNALILKKDGGSIDAITAATISSRAVANGVHEGMEWYKKAVEGTVPIYGRSEAEP